jgi:hypothetical protein
MKKSHQKSKYSFAECCFTKFGQTTFGSYARCVTSLSFKKGNTILLIVLSYCPTGNSTLILWFILQTYMKSHKKAKYSFAQSFSNIWIYSTQLKVCEKNVVKKAVNQQLLYNSCATFVHIFYNFCIFSVLLHTFAYFGHI